VVAVVQVQSFLGKERMPQASEAVGRWRRAHLLEKINYANFRKNPILSF
jgi:hypothetical protein